MSSRRDNASKAKERKGVVLLIRHGHSSHVGSNSRSFFAGSALNTTLTERGEKETMDLADAIVKKVGHVDNIFFTPLQRSKETASVLKKYIEKKTGKQVKISEMSDAIEADVGDFTGRDSTEVKKKYPKRSKFFYEHEIEMLDFPGGEDFASIKKRAETVIEHIKRHIKNNRNVVIVGHGIFNSVLSNVIGAKDSQWTDFDRILEVNKYL